MSLYEKFLCYKKPILILFLFDHQVCRDRCHYAVTGRVHHQDTVKKLLFRHKLESLLFEYVDSHRKDVGGWLEFLSVMRCRTTIV